MAWHQGLKNAHASLVKSLGRRDRVWGSRWGMMEVRILLTLLAFPNELHIVIRYGLPVVGDPKQFVGKCSSFNVASTYPFMNLHEDNGGLTPS